MEISWHFIENQQIETKSFLRDSDSKGYWNEVAQILQNEEKPKIDENLQNQKNIEINQFTISLIYFKLIFENYYKFGDWYPNRKLINSNILEKNIIELINLIKITEILIKNIIQ